MTKPKVVLPKSYCYEIKELVELVRMDEKYVALMADGFLPLDLESSVYNFQRKNRIEELSQKFGLI
ncbi:hypothetical protein [Pseudomonas savastanoi]|uniref:hypothetical protein n=1 Tax=Pseudomonas savastanoi TaxID=29438 RepID=UPI000EFED0B6|nr:hypothetical protein [Pseudomonas savastanoi]RMU16103.1 hypothetical protein ALP35_04120 [Pseudomonas savastanoi pv. glycinea]